MRPPCVLTVAGSDSGGGAGIQADLKTFMMQGCYGLSVITALTAQNTRAVSAIEAPSPSFVAAQLRAVLDDFPIGAAKTGMLFSAPIIEAVAGELSAKDFPLVVDPVCVAQSGTRLLLPEAVEALKARILPLADLVTPNRQEAELLAEMEIRTPEDAREAMERLLGRGAKAVLLKGGHFEPENEAGEAVLTDWLLTADGQVRGLVRPHVSTRNTHGTGCTLAAAIAAHLGLGKPLPQAVEAARDYLQLALRAAYDLGGGDGPVNHLAPFFRQREGLAVLGELERSGWALSRLEGLFRLIPDVGLNVALAVPYAEGLDDVAAFSGRICRDRRGRLSRAGCPAFGASERTARVVLAAASVVPEVRCAAAIRCDEEILAALEATGLVAMSFDFAELSELEAQSLEQGVRLALAGHPEPATVAAIWDYGAVGKEPLIRILGRNAPEVLARIKAVALRVAEPFL